MDHRGETVQQSHAESIAKYLFRDIASVSVMMATKDFLFEQPVFGVGDE